MDALQVQSANVGTWFKDLPVKDIWRIVFLYFAPSDLVDALKSVPLLRMYVNCDILKTYWEYWFHRDFPNQRKQNGLFELIGILGFKEFIDWTWKSYTYYNISFSYIIRGLLIGDHSGLMKLLYFEYQDLINDPEEYFLIAIRNANVVNIQGYWNNIMQSNSHLDLWDEDYVDIQQILRDALQLIGQYQPRNTMLYQICNDLTLSNGAFFNPIFYYTMGLVKGSHDQILEEVYANQSKLFDTGIVSDRWGSKYLKDYLIIIAASENNNRMVELLLGFGASHQCIIRGIINSMATHNCAFYENMEYFDHEHYAMFQKYMPYVKQEEWTELLNEAIDNHKIPLIINICVDLAKLPDDKRPQNYHLFCLKMILKRSCRWWSGKNKRFDFEIDQFIQLYHIFKTKGYPVNLRELLGARGIKTEVATHPKIIALLE